jgi:hypothetical protein
MMEKFTMFRDGYAGGPHLVLWCVERARIRRSLATTTESCSPSFSPDTSALWQRRPRRLNSGIPLHRPAGGRATIQHTYRVAFV